MNFWHVSDSQVQKEQFYAVFGPYFSLILARARGLISCSVSKEIEGREKREGR